MASLTCNDTDRLWKMDDAAAYLGVAPRTVWRWVRDAGFPVVRFQGCTRFSRAEIDEWVDASRAA